ncbi:MAG: hypothetical protein U0271_31690 [Polyangiaceae bacterium]
MQLGSVAARPLRDDCVASTSGQSLTVLFALVPAARDEWARDSVSDVARREDKEARLLAKAQAQAEARLRAEAKALEMQAAAERERLEREARARFVDAELQRFHGVRARNEALEQSLLEDPDDPRGWAVFVDWLQSQGDIRGELGARDLCPEVERSRFDISVEEIWTRFRDELWDTLGARYPVCVGRANADFRWHCGFIRSATLRRSTAVSMTDLLMSLYGSWCGRFVRKLELVHDQPSDDTREAIVPTFAACPTLRELHLSNAPEWASGAERLFEVAPKLTRLELGEHTPIMGIAHELTHLKVTPLKRESGAAYPLRCLEDASFPALEHLELVGEMEHAQALGGVLHKFLARDGLPRLRHLKVVGVGADCLGAAFRTPPIQRLGILDICLNTELEVSAFLRDARPLTVTPARVRIWMRGLIGPIALRSIRAALPKFEYWDGGSSTALPKNTTPWWG